MIKRTAGRNPDDKRAFWGCARYPDCDGLVAIDQATREESAG